MTILFADDEFSGILNVADQEVTPHKDYVTIGLVGECEARDIYVARKCLVVSLITNNH